MDAPLHLFRFAVSFSESPLGGGGGGPVDLVAGAFSEVSGIEASIEPKAIKEGGRNYGSHQRVGPVSFATVILKRGVTPAQDLWTWFSLVGNGAYAHRLTATIEVLDIEGNPAFAWSLANALPVKFRAGELNARASEVGVEELHIVHEGLYAA